MVKEFNPKEIAEITHATRDMTNRLATANLAGEREALRRLDEMDGPWEENIVVDVVDGTSGSRGGR